MRSEEGRHVRRNGNKMAADISSNIIAQTDTTIADKGLLFRSRIVKPFVDLSQRKAQRLKPVHKFLFTLVFSTGHLPTDTNSLILPLLYQTGFVAGHVCVFKDCPIWADRTLESSAKRFGVSYGVPG